MMVLILSNLLWHESKLSQVNKITSADDDYIQITTDKF